MYDWRVWPGRVWPGSDTLDGLLLFCSPECWRNQSDFLENQMTEFLYRGRGGGGLEQGKVTPRNSGKLQLFIAYFWHHNWIV